MNWKIIKTNLEVLQEALLSHYPNLIPLDKFYTSFADSSNRFIYYREFMNSEVENQKLTARFDIFSKTVILMEFKGIIQVS